MQKARLAIIILFVGIIPVVVFGGAWLYFRADPAASAPKAPPPPKPLPVVLTASRDLTIGSLITANDVIWSPVKNSAVLSTYMLKGKTKPADVIGAVVRRAVYKGTPLTWSSIVRPGQYGFLAAALRPNHRAVTIMVNRATSQAGLIYPGDRVDVILTVQVKEDGTRKTNTFTGTILENIRVVAVNRQVESSIANQGGQANSRTSRNAASTITLEVLPSEAERLVLANSKGNISLAMRSLTDGRRRDTLTATVFENLLSLPPPPEADPEPVAAAPQAPPPPPPPAETEPVRVQIFRGGARQEVLLKK